MVGCLEMQSITAYRLYEIDQHTVKTEFDITVVIFYADEGSHAGREISSSHLMRQRFG
jgi:hypothetical protein